MQVIIDDIIATGVGPIEDRWGSIAEYVVSVWGLGQRTAESIEAHINRREDEGNLT